MLRDSKLSRRNSGKNLNFEEIENVPVNVNLREPSVRRMSFDSSSRPPLNSIEDPVRNPSKPGQESSFKTSKTFRTPTKPKIRHQEPATSMRTPEKQGVLARDRFGRGYESTVITPRTCRTPGRPSLGFSELNSTHTTPTKTVTKPPNPGFTHGGSSRPPVRTGNFAALSKGIPVTSTTHTPVNTIDVPHFDLSEDPSFWMDHNVQVLIRVRPLNNMEINSQGYNRCLRQESAQSLTCVGHGYPESRFTFDHVACETIDQETLFKMVGQPMVENCLSGYNSCMFAYGQTGSGKTHTMLGEINNLEVKPSPYRGMTPRIFEFLFSRIIAEEGSRKNERLTYNCKCSFLEIYNEQITDLLDPSSTNLQIREDVKKGVYVDNLTEFEVHTVGDILRLLSQGSQNRRVASTNMNRESSRSHSVFTCVIESRWEKDSTTNLRFARLNLVDLAGSERQKSSGAEGERLKEAANINKSLSTLGNVIMVLVGANARTHVPYRDSKLTFLLQDSLGGNSKTMIIANVSPSISSATETLNTLKFAQRAKLIQNNAVINEDASGDVEALQHQIRLLKEEVATLKRLNISRSRTYNTENENCSISSSLDDYEDDDKVLRVSCKQLKSLTTSLNGSLRREQSTENSIKQLEAEIEQLNSLVHQREEENRCTKMILKFREDKIQGMESLLTGSLTVDSYLLQENKMVNEEVKLLRAKYDRNPEVTRFAVENIRLLEQLRRFQDFYKEGGEREMLLSEVSELRDQLVLCLDQSSISNSNQDNDIEKDDKEEKKEDNSIQLELKLKKSQEELEKCMDKLNSCLEENAKLSREIADLNDLMQKSVVNEQYGGIDVIKEPVLEASTIDDHSTHTIENTDENFADNTKEVLDLQLQVEILKIILKEERLTRAEIEEKATRSITDSKLTEEKFLLITKQCENLKDELQEAKSVIEALESQNLVSINELEASNNQYAEILREKELEITSLNEKIISQATSSAIHLENESSQLETKLNKVQDSLEKAKILNDLYQNDRACHDVNEEQMDQVRKQVEDETTQVIVCLQEELCSFQERILVSGLKEKEMQQELIILKEKLDVMTECNTRLREEYEEKDKELCCLSEEIEGVLKGGHMALDDAFDQLLVNGKREWVSDKLQTIARNVSEKELRIQELNSCLEDAKDRGNEMESMLRSLRGATLVMSEAHEQDCIKKDQQIHQLEGEIDKLKESLAEKDLIHSLKVESCCHLDKLAEMDFVIKKMVNENEAMKKKEVTLMKKIESYLILEEQIEIDTIEKNKEIDKLKESLAEKDLIQSLKVESCCYLEKLAEMDFIINKMVTENEEMKKKEVTFMKKIASYSILEEQIETDTNKMNEEVEEIYHMILEIKGKVDEDLVPMASDFNDIKSSFHELLTWHEEIWCEIIAKDLAVSVLNLCHMEILMETMAGLNVEKGLVSHGLCESNSLLSELKKQNDKSRKDLEACSMLRGKLLVDIKNTFDRVSRKEEETGKLSKKVDSFEKKILDLKVMEETMLERFNHMGHELCTLMKEIDEKEKVIYDEDEEKLVIDSCSKEIELFLKLEQRDCLINDLENEKIGMSMVIEKFKEDMIISFVDMQLEDAIEVDFLKEEVNMQEEALKVSCKKNFDLEISSWKLQHELAMKVEELKLEKEEKVIYDEDEEKLVIDSCSKEIELFLKLEQRDCLINDLKNEKVGMSMVFEKFKEDMIISFVDMQLKDAIEVDYVKEEVEMQEETLKVSCNKYSDLEISSCKLQHELEMKVKELKLQKEENKNLVVTLKNQKHEIEGLECEVYESVVKHHVFEANLKSLSSLLTKNSEDALIAKKRLEMEIVELESVVNENQSNIKRLKKDLKRVTFERDNIVEEKEKELKVYEKSVEELDITVNVLENQLEMVQRDAERQKLQREEIELELRELKQQIHSGSNMQRELDEKEKEIQDLLRRNIVLQKEITELNLKATEHKETVKEMEATTPVTSSPYNLNSPLKRSGSRSRGGAVSPFKCIRLGFVQKDEDLISAKIRIQELESQLEELNQQLQKNEYREICDMYRSREEVEGLKVALEQYREQNQLLKTENEAFKSEIDNLKKDVMELEAEGERNLQQQIQLHAKIKEENNALKAQNDEICHKLKKAESILRRVKEELAYVQKAKSERNY